MATKVRTRKGKPMKLAHKNCLKMWEIIANMPTYILISEYTNEPMIDVMTIKRAAIREFDDPDKIENYCYLCEEYNAGDKLGCEICPIAIANPVGSRYYFCGKHYETFIRACHDRNEQKIHDAAHLFLAELKEKLK